MPLFSHMTRYQALYLTHRTQFKPWDTVFPPGCYINLEGCKNEQFVQTSGVVRCRVFLVAGR